MARVSTALMGSASAIAVGCSVVTFSAPVATAAPSTPTTFTVNTTADAAAAQPFGGQCVTVSGECSVRAAVQAANARPGSTIVIPAGRYVLTVAPNLLNTQGPFVDPTAGDLNITAATTIVGAGAEDTIIDANKIDRVFMITADATISGLTATNGEVREHEIAFYETGGGAILNSGHLKLDHVILSGSLAGFGGAIQNLPWSDMVMSNSLVKGNHAGETGGVRCDNTCTITDSVITDNHATNPLKWYLPSGQAGRGGGLDFRGFADVRIDRTTITGNSATDAGGGIQIAPGYFDTLGPFPEPKLANLYVRDSLIAHNTVAGRSENCGKAFAGIVSEGGNRTDDPSCGFNGPGDVVGPIENLEGTPVWAF